MMAEKLRTIFTCGVLLRRNYFSNSICSKFESAAIISTKSFLREIHLKCGVASTIDLNNDTDIG